MPLTTPRRLGSTRVKRSLFSIISLWTVIQGAALLCCHHDQFAHCVKTCSQFRSSFLFMPLSLLPMLGDPAKPLRGTAVNHYTTVKNSTGTKSYTLILYCGTDLEWVVSSFLSISNLRSCDLIDVQRSMLALFILRYNKTEAQGPPCLSTSKTAWKKKWHDLWPFRNKYNPSTIPTWCHSSITSFRAWSPEKTPN